MKQSDAFINGLLAIVKNEVGNIQVMNILLETLNNYGAVYYFDRIFNLASQYMPRL